MIRKFSASVQGLESVCDFFPLPCHPKWAPREVNHGPEMLGYPLRGLPGTGYMNENELVLVFKQTLARENHGHICLVTSLDNLKIAF